MGLVKVIGSLDWTEFLFIKAFLKGLIDEALVLIIATRLVMTTRSNNSSNSAQVTRKPRARSGARLLRWIDGKEGRQEARKEGRKEGRKQGRKEGNKEGRKERRKKRKVPF